jgi:uncharacterized membrane protein YdjX (TVP38/TMEM64 family)
MKGAASANCLMSDKPQPEKPVVGADSEVTVPTLQRPIREIIIGGVGFLVFMTLLVIGIDAIGVDNLQQIIRDAGALAPLLYIGLKAVTYVFAPLTSGPIQVLAGTLFDSLWLGILYTLIGEVIGGSINFWIARRWGRRVVLYLVGKDGIAEIESFYKGRLDSWTSLAVARLVLFSVWDFLSYALGLAKSVRFSTYIFVSTVFGFFPTFAFVWMGTTAINDNRAMLLIYAFVAILILIPVFARRQINDLLLWASGRKKKHDDAD